MEISSRVCSDDGVTPSSGSDAFDKFRDALVSNKSIHRELERALDLNVHRVNPSDRAGRFISGGAVEWILAATAYKAGVLAIPGGHGANGFDLRDLLEDARGLWSVKNSTTDKKSAYRLSNGLGGGGAGFVDATVFLSPHLPGIVFGDPDVHTRLAAQQQEKGDAVVLPFAAVAGHAEAHPECVAKCDMPVNPGTGTHDAGMDYVENLLTPEHFPDLSGLFVAAKPVAGTLVSELQVLVDKRDAGAITEAQFDELVRKIGR